MEGVGRCVEAARDIRPGELIFREEALVIGPNHDTPPLCLSCLKVVNTINTFLMAMVMMT